MQTVKTLMMLSICFLILVACDTDPEAQYRTGDVLLQQTFEDAPTWDNLARDAVSVGTRAGAYRMVANVNSYVRGFERVEQFDNVVIEFETNQYTQERNNAYGVICRGSTDPLGTNGYYFLIAADGSYSIRIGQYREVNGLVKWRSHQAINEGLSRNRIRVICIDDYLALYVNDTFIADVRDDTYSRGYLGFVVTTEATTEIEIAFDNLIVMVGELVE